MSYLFTQEQGNLLVRLLLAHILADFVLQTAAMVEKKPRFFKYMALHILIVGICTFLLSLSWKLTLVIAASHWLIDSLKESIQKKEMAKKHILFMADQLLHLLFIIALWAYKFKLIGACIAAVAFPFSNYKLSLYLLAYAFAIWPLGYLIKFALQNMVTQSTSSNMEHGGKLIGQFERIIILTFVFLGQYEAIGFLITGKSIIRFADHNPELKSEYVLVGTMMSYALSILLGLFIKWLI